MNIPNRDDFGYIMILTSFIIVFVTYMLYRKTKKWYDLLFLGVTIGFSFSIIIFKLFKFIIM